MCLGNLLFTSSTLHFFRLTTKARYPLYNFLFQFEKETSKSPLLTGTDCRRQQETATLPGTWCAKPAQTYIPDVVETKFGNQGSIGVHWILVEFA